MIRTEAEYIELEEKLKRAEGRAVIIRKPLAEVVYTAKKATDLGVAMIWPIFLSIAGALVLARLLWLLYTHF